jgi:hypothetical protein
MNSEQNLEVNHLYIVESKLDRFGVSGRVHKVKVLDKTGTSILIEWPTGDQVRYRQSFFLEEYKILEELGQADD